MIASQVIELIAAGSCVVGFAMTWKATQYAHQDLKDLRVTGINGDILMVAKGNTRSQILRSTKMLLLLGIALGDVFTSPASWLVDVRTGRGVAIVVIAAIMSYDAWQDMQERRAVVRAGKNNGEL